MIEHTFTYQDVTFRVRRETVKAYLRRTWLLGALWRQQPDPDAATLYAWSTFARFLAQAELVVGTPPAWWGALPDDSAVQAAFAAWSEEAGSLADHIVTALAAVDVTLAPAETTSEGGAGATKKTP